MTLYETIFTRRSVRKYDPTPLDESTLADINAFLNRANQLNTHHARFEIVTGDKVGDKSAPHYIVAYCGENTAAYVNVGYVLEKVDLYLQSIGLGSLWLGMAKPKEDKQDFCIMLAFGNTSVPARKNVEEFNRLPISEISNSDNSGNCDIAKAVRLAPSAVNNQPWKLKFEEGCVTIGYFGRGLMKLILKNRLNKIDLGICTRFVIEALRHEGKHIKSIEPKTEGKEFEVAVEYE